jgi:hypothetical protein
MAFMARNAHNLSEQSLVRDFVYGVETIFFFSKNKEMEIVPILTGCPCFNFRVPSHVQYI